VPIALFALFLCSYNVLRIWLARLRNRLHRESQAPPVRPRRREEPPNPAFDFSDAPPEGPNEPR
jgi:hypothetical protein